MSRLPTSAPSPIDVVCGPGGGGVILVDAVLRELGVLGQARRDGPDRWSWPGGDLVDAVASVGLGGCPTPPVATVVLVRDRGGRRVAVDLTDDDPAIDALLRGILAVQPGCTDELAGELVRLTGPATAIWAEVLIDPVAGQAGETVRAIARAPTTRALRAEVIARGGTRLLDLGRVLVLGDGEPVHLGDEWPGLAAGLAGRRYSVADADIILHDFPSLFRVVHGPEGEMVEIAGPLARHLLVGDVATSASEHLTLYRLLRARAVAGFGRRDSADAFIARSLPAQALAADALPELVSDPLAVLASDVDELAVALEASEHQLSSAAAKAFLLCAHRLRTEADRPSQLELSARRLELHGYAQRVADTFPDRRWHPVWAQPRQAHVHRLLLDHDASLMCIAADPAPTGQAAVASSDGTIWVVGTASPVVRLTQSDSIDAEVRAIAMASTCDGSRVAAATSGHEVVVLDPETLRVVWRDQSDHSAPLSAVAVDPAGLVASAGVEGVIRFHSLLDGTYRPELDHRHDAEVRGLSFLPGTGRRLVAFGAVDGVAALVDVDARLVIGRWRLGDHVVNAIDVALQDDRLVLVGGLSNGEIISVTAPLGARGEVEPADLQSVQIRVVCCAERAVTSVRLLGAGDVAYGSEDGSWVLRDLDLDGDVTRLLGHVAPVWGLARVQRGSVGYVLSVGGEGACRAWRVPVAGEGVSGVNQSRARQGAVSAVALAAGTDGVPLIVTGATTGEVRLGRLGDPSMGRSTISHLNEVSSLLILPGLVDGEHRLLSGSHDGVLRLTELTLPGRGTSSVLGIAHDGIETLSHAQVDGEPMFVSGGRDGTVTVWSLPACEPVRTIRAAKWGSVTSACPLGAFPGGATVVGSQDGTVSLRAGASLEEQWSTRLRAGVLALSPLPVTRGFVAGLADGTVAIITGLERFTPRVSYMTAMASEARALAAITLGDCEYVAVTGSSRRLLFLETVTGRTIFDIALEGQGLTVAVRDQHIALGTSAGASLLRLSDDPILLEGAD